MVSMGFEPGATGWKVQTNFLNVKCASIRYMLSIPTSGIIRSLKTRTHDLMIWGSHKPRSSFVEIVKGSCLVVQMLTLLAFYLK